MKKLNSRRILPLVAAAALFAALLGAVAPSHALAAPPPEAHQVCDTLHPIQGLTEKEYAMYEGDTITFNPVEAGEVLAVQADEDHGFSLGQYEAATSSDMTTRYVREVADGSYTSKLMVLKTWEYTSMPIRVKIMGDPKASVTVCYTIDQ